VLPVESDRFLVLQAEFETLFKQLKASKDPSERVGLLRELREVLARMDETALVQRGV
jgi:hypothetical protein